MNIDFILKAEDREEILQLYKENSDILGRGNHFEHDIRLFAEYLFQLQYRLNRPLVITGNCGAGKTVLTKLIEQNFENKINTYSVYEDEIINLENEEKALKIERIEENLEKEEELLIIDNAFLHFGIRSAPNLLPFPKQKMILTVFSLSHLGLKKVSEESFIHVSLDNMALHVPETIQVDFHYKGGLLQLNDVIAAARRENLQ